VSEPWWAGPGDQRRGTGRTWTTRGVATGALALMVVVGAATVGATSPHISETTSSRYGTDVRPTVKALAAGCGVSQFVKEPDSWIGTVQINGELTYEPVVPVSGWFSATPAAPGDAAATPEQVLRSMWSGDRVIWVAVGTPARVTAQLEQMVGAHPQWGAVVRAWPAGRTAQMPAGTYAAAAWGLTQTCKTPDSGVIDALFAAAPKAPGSVAGTPVPVFGAGHGR
jgi:hypothetical protein